MIAAGLGLTAFCGGLWLLGARGVTPSDTLARGPALTAGLLIAAGVLAWAIGLRLA